MFVVVLKRIIYQIKMSKNKFCKVLCSIDLTIPTRVIGLIGIVLSVLLISVLIHDKHVGNFKYSRITALALGLNWQHFYSHANASREADSDGRLITTICLSYAFLYSVTNALLILATTVRNRWYVVPWFVYETFSCISKMVALYQHLTSHLNNVNKTFVIGSFLYIVLILSSLLVVFATQLRWNKSKKVINLNLTPSDLNTLMNGRYIMTTPRRDSNYYHVFADKSFVDSPVPYTSDSYNMI